MTMTDTMDPLSGVHPDLETGLMPRTLRKQAADGARGGVRVSADPDAVRGPAVVGNDVEDDEEAVGDVWKVRVCALCARVRGRGSEGVCAPDPA